MPFGSGDLMSIKQRILNNLLTVKSIITFALTGAFVYLTIIKEVKPELFMSVYTVVVGFYFGTQYNDKKDER